MTRVAIEWVTALAISLVMIRLLLPEFSLLLSLTALVQVLMCAPFDERLLDRGTGGARR